MRAADSLPRLAAALIAASCVVLAAPAAAVAVPAWQAPVTISPAGETGFVPEVAVDPGGDAVAVWAANGPIEAAARPPGACFARPERISSTGTFNGYPQVALDSGGNALAVWLGSRGEIQAAVRPAGESFGPVETIPEPGERPSVPDVAVNPKGDAVVVWVGGSGVRAAARPAGGTFAPPQTISAPVQYIFSLQVAIDPAGSALAVWQRQNGTDSRVEAAARPAGGSFGAVQTLSGPDQRPGPPPVSPQVALDSHGNGIAVWDRFDGGADQMQAAFRPAGGSFGAPQTIPDPVPGFVNGPGPSLGVDSQGNAVAAWSRGHVGSRGTFDGRIQAALRPARGSFGPAQTISVGDTNIAPDVAVNAHGDAVVAWGARVAPPDAREIDAAVRPAGASFGTPEAISDQPEYVGNPWAAAAVDSRGDAIAVWSREDFKVRAAAYGSPPASCAPPSLSRLALRPKRFRAARRGPTVSTRVGSRVGYALSLPARVRFRVDRVKRGRRVRGRCRRPTARNRGHRRCTRYIRLRGSFTHRGNEGRNRFTFRGRLRHRRLHPGRYRLSARATDFAGRRSSIKRRRFRIVRR